MDPPGKPVFSSSTPPDGFAGHVTPVLAHTPCSHNRGQHCTPSRDDAPPLHRSLLRPNHSSQSPFADYIPSPPYEPHHHHHHHHHTHRRSYNCQSSRCDTCLPSNQGFTSRGDLNASGARGFVSCSLDDACSRGFSPGNKRFSRDFDDLGALGSFTPGSKGIPCEFDDSRSHGLATSKRVFPREFSSREFVDGSGSCRFTSCEFSELGTHEFGSRGFDNSSSHRCADSVGEEHLPFPGTLSEGTNYYSYRDSSNEITLYRWYLVRTDDCHNPGIGVGGFLSTIAMDNETKETTTIVKRLEERKLLTRNGVVVNLMGIINERATVANGFPLQMVQLFLSGFPNIWNLLVGMAFSVKQRAAASCPEFLGGGVMPGSFNLERDTKHLRQSLFPESKGKLPSSSHDLGNRAEANTEKNSHVDGSMNIQISPKRQESTLNMEIPKEHGEGIVHNNPLQDRLGCVVGSKNVLSEQENIGAEPIILAHDCGKLKDDAIAKGCAVENSQNQNKGEQVDAAIATNFNTPEDNPLSKISARDMEKTEASTPGVDIDAVADSCGELNKNLEVPCIESPIQDACEIEHSNMEAIALKDGSKKRKVRFRSKSDSVSGSSSQTKKRSETKRVCLEPFDNIDHQQQSDQTEDTELEIEHLRKGITRKKVIAKKRGKPRKKVRLCLPKPRRLIKGVVSKQEYKKSVSLHGEEKMETNESLKIAPEEQEGETHHTNNIEADSNASLNEEDDMEADQALELEEKNCREAQQNMDSKARIVSCISRCSSTTINSPEDECSIRDNPKDIKVAKHRLPPPLPAPTVSVSNQLVSKAFGLKTSRSGRLLVPPLAHWRNQSIVRDSDGGIIAIEDGSEDTLRVDTGRFNFKPPLEARARRLQEWLSVTATQCFTKKLNSRPKKKKKMVT